MNATQTPTAWYRVPVAWLVLMIPVTCVVGCMFTIYLAVTNPDVIYKRGADNTQAADQQ